MTIETLDIVELARRVKLATPAGRRVFVGIDGLGASGKSTLAAQLVAAMGDACLVHGDDFYLPTARRRERQGESGPAFDLPRLAEQVVKPGSSGREFRYQRYDWAKDELTDWIDVPEGRPLVLEGVFCFADAMRDAYTFKIWCHADPELRLARGIARDGEEARSLWADIWMPAENDYVARQHPERSADLVVDSSPIDGGRLAFRAARSR